MKRSKRIMAVTLTLCLLMACALGAASAESTNSITANQRHGGQQTPGWNGTDGSSGATQLPGQSNGQQTPGQQLPGWNSNQQTPNQQTPNQQTPNQQAPDRQTPGRNNNGRPGRGQHPGFRTAQGQVVDFDQMLQAGVIDQATYDAIMAYLQQTAAAQPEAPAGDAGAPANPADGTAPEAPAGDAAESDPLAGLVASGMITQEQYDAISAALAK